MRCLNKLPPLNVYFGTGPSHPGKNVSESYSRFASVAALSELTFRDEADAARCPSKRRHPRHGN